MSTTSTDKDFARNSRWVEEDFKINHMNKSAFKRANGATKEIQNTMARHSRRL